MQNINKGKIFKHYLGTFHQIINVVNDSLSDEQMVIYKDLDTNHQTWAMPESQFDLEFKEYKRDYKKDGLKAFLGLKFYDGDASKKLVDGITDALSPLNIRTFVAVRDIEKYGEVKGLDMAHFMPKYTFPEMETSDIMIIEYSEAGAGLGMCADHAYCNNVPVYLIAKTGSKISTTVNSVAEKVIFYNDISDITKSFQELIENGELKTNPNTCVIQSENFPIKE